MKGRRRLRAVRRHRARSSPFYLPSSETLTELSSREAVDGMGSRPRIGMWGWTGHRREWLKSGLAPSARRAGQGGAAMRIIGSTPQFRAKFNLWDSGGGFCRYKVSFRLAFSSERPRESAVSALVIVVENGPKRSERSTFTSLSRAEV